MQLKSLCVRKRALRKDRKTRSEGEERKRGKKSDYEGSKWNKNEREAENGVASFIKKSFSLSLLFPWKYMHSHEKSPYPLKG